MALEDHERQEPGEILTPFVRHWQEIRKSSSRRNPLTNLCQSTFNRITRKDLRKRPYKIQTRHALEPGDPARRLRFCNWLLQMPQGTLAETCIVDESNFYMNGTVSRQNTRRYADRNNPPRNFVYNKPKDRRKWVVFAAHVGNTIIGPVFLERSIDNQVYWDLIIVPVSAGHFSNSRMGFFAECGICRMVLLLTVPNLFAIARKSFLAIVWLEGTSDWLASQNSRSHLSSLDFYLWGTVKQRVYRQGPPASLQQLRNRITDAFNEIRHTREVRRAVRHTETRAQRCINIQGGHVDGRVGLQWALSYNMICSTKTNGAFQNQQRPNGPFQGHQKTKEERKTLAHALLKGCGMGPCLVLVSPCFRKNVVATCKIGSFLCSLHNLLQKNVIVLFFGNQISKWNSFEKGLLLTYFSHSLVTREKVTKIPLPHISLTYIHVFCSPYWLFLPYQFWKKYEFIRYGFSLVEVLVLILIPAILVQSINNKMMSKI